jgi:hypothetical protein
LDAAFAFSCFNAQASVLLWREACLTPEFTCRESTTSCGKFSMKGLLIPVRCNELFGGNFRCDHPPLMMVLLSTIIQCHFRLKAQQPNARIDPPEHNCANGKLTMRVALFPVGSNELFGGASDVSLQRWLCFIRAYHSIQLRLYGAAAERPN